MTRRMPIYKLFKSLADRLIALFLFVLFMPILALFSFLIYLQDFSIPFYLARRVSRGMGYFYMIKLRSMVVNADSFNVFSTSISDPRITPIGRLVRNYKIDEIPQLINVLWGQMSFVGPRPNTMSHGVELYNSSELRLMSVLPGVTDASSLVFSDESSILRNSPDPDYDYNRLIRPWKSRLSLWHISNSSFILDFVVIVLTIVNVFSRSLAMWSLNYVMIAWYDTECFTPIVMRTASLEGLTDNVSSVPYF